MRLRHLLGARGNRGQSLVELALTLPILMMILMGIIDLSFVLYASIQVAAASGEGARAGALFPGDLNQSVATNDAARDTAVRKAIYDSSTGGTTLGLLKTTLPNFDVSSAAFVEITYPNAYQSATRTGEPIVVTVRYKQPVWFEFLPGVVAGTFQVSSSTRMRMQ